MNDLESLSNNRIQSTSGIVAFNDNVIGGPAIAAGSYLSPVD